MLNKIHFTKVENFTYPRRFLAILLAGLLVLISVSPAFAMVGPVPTPPGGVTVNPPPPLPEIVGRGIGLPGGLTFIYSGFDSSQYENLYWGIAGSQAVSFSMDNAVDQAGEVMTFAPSAAEQTAGIAYWMGNATVAVFTNNILGVVGLPTRFTLKVTDLADSPIPLHLASDFGIATPGVAFKVTGDFKANMLMEVFDGGAWQPALAWFNLASTACDMCVLSSFEPGFYYTDVAISGLQFVNNGPAATGDSVAFDAQIASGTNVTYAWDFGDGSAGSGASTSHSFAAPGDYTVTLTATNDTGSVTANTLIVVQTAVSGLTASNDGPTFIGNPTHLTASISTGTNVHFSWDFGDGQGGTGATITHTYAQSGSYTASVTAANDVSASTTATQVTVTGSRVFLPMVTRGFHSGTMIFPF